ncbi:ABC transporter ATP-binding protein [Rhodococcus sp. D2-41]|uniref:ABC transporter ATP-binding protein n=1 Tax=Speluncibacter jeojiensis TaxID=2710754 RepID=A0A9X4RDE7_9ACTN|nr:ABC transporter ATP-binding protein [Rhodococcus sp. D2-41]MDG3009777.1 ABC transporter ATP-binding protein [Rhodococcus sp. D2-41]MDG3014528.1 ABC transporter ATP-binding protein [Corynebacteriales bacterium D3-21]
MTTIIDARAVEKTFGRTRALDGLDLQVTEGEAHGFLGPNGAGKSTTIRILLGALRHTGGRVTLFGRDPWADAVDLHRHIAYVPGDVTLWPSLTGGETIDLIGSMRGTLDRGRRDELIERFDLDPRKKARTYSKGNRQKVALISALASNAGLLLLDEPTSGLDPLMEQVFRECVGEARMNGATVLLSSHILSEVEQLCERVTIIRAGKTVETGSLASMQHLSRSLITAELVDTGTDFTTISGVEDVRVDGNTLTCQAGNASLTAVLRALGEAGVRSVTCRPPTLEELFLRHYEGADDAPAEAGVRS